MHGYMVLSIRVLQRHAINKNKDDCVSRNRYDVAIFLYRTIVATGAKGTYGSCLLNRPRARSRVSRKSDEKYERAMAAGDKTRRRRSQLVHINIYAVEN